MRVNERATAISRQPAPASQIGARPTKHLKAGQSAGVGRRMSMIVGYTGLAVLLVLGAADDPVAARLEQPDDEAIEVVVEAPRRPEWLFPSLDHPRVRAFFGSSSMVGGSLFDEQAEPELRPLVRAGTIKVRSTTTKTTSAAERRAARRFARELVASVRPALEACYVDTLHRSPSDATRLTFRVELSGSDRGPVRVADGTLGDVYGNACVHGVLEFAAVEAPALAASLEIPVWFWLQTSPPT
jgi:hypothetical protein